MKYAKLNDLMNRFDEVRVEADTIRDALRALGVTDLPGDPPAPHGLHTHSAMPLGSPKPAPGNLPGEPTEEMVMAAVDAACDLRQPVDLDIMRASLRAALAAAPRVEAEIPEIDQSDVDYAVKIWHATEGLLDDQLGVILRGCRRRLIEMRGQS